MRGAGWIAVATAGLLTALGLVGLRACAARPEGWTRLRPAMVAGAYAAVVVLLAVGAVVQFGGGSRSAGTRVWQLAFLLLAIATGGAFVPAPLGAQLVTGAAAVATVGTLAALWGV